MGEAQFRQNKNAQVFQVSALPSWGHQQPRGVSDSENPAASLLLTSPHICPELTCSLCFLWGAWVLKLKFFSQMYNVVRGGVTLNKCFKVVQRCCVNAKAHRCSFPSRAGFHCPRVTSLAITDRWRFPHTQQTACFPLADSPATFFYFPKLDTLFNRLQH